MRLAACVILLVFAVALAASVGPARSGAALGRPGLKTVLTETTSAPALTVTRRIEYIQSDRRRSELWDGRHAKFVSITRCDLSRNYILDLEARDYDWMPLLPVPTHGRVRQYAAWWGGKPQAGNATHLIELETRDTGERKMVFGREARHVITTRKQKPVAQGAVDSSEVTVDGWYIDLDRRISCEPQSAGAAFLIAQVGYGAAVFSLKTVGKPEGGFMVEGETTSRHTSSGPNGAFTEIPSTIRTQLTVLSEEPLAPSLFEIPPGFQRRRVPFSELLSRYWSELKATAWHLLY